MIQDKLMGKTKLDRILSDVFEYYNGIAIVFPRYPIQEKIIRGKFNENVIIPERAVDTLSLSYYADLSITGGATMAREAAAIGTPGISYFPRALDVLDYIAKLGIPLYNEHQLEGAIEQTRKILQKGVNKAILREKTQNILMRLESPVKPIKDIISEHRESLR